MAAARVGSSISRVLPTRLHRTIRGVEARLCAPIADQRGLTAVATSVGAVLMAARHLLQLIFAGVTPAHSSKGTTP